MKVKRGEFWLGQGGVILRAARSAKRGEATVPAEVYRQEPGVGRVAPTGETRQLRALREGGTNCHVATLVESDSEAESDGEGGSGGDDSMGEAGEHEYGGGGTPADLAADIGREYRHVLLAPAGIKKVAPTRGSWRGNGQSPETTEEARLVRLDGAKTRAIRDTFAA